MASFVNPVAGISKNARSVSPVPLRHDRRLAAPKRSVGGGEDGRLTSFINDNALKIQMKWIQTGSVFG
jgi:hypothetical protein